MTRNYYEEILKDISNARNWFDCHKIENDLDWLYYGGTIAGASLLTDSQHDDLRASLALKRSFLDV